MYEWDHSYTLCTKSSDAEDPGVGSIDETNAQQPKEVQKMISPVENTKVCEDKPVSIRAKLAGLWIAAMFCYIYADILSLYDPWLLEEILKGNLGFVGPITQSLKLGIGLLMSIPALMVIACCFASVAKCRGLNIIFGAIKTLVIAITLVISTHYYYIYFAVLEIAITSSIVWLSWKWPSNIKSITALQINTHSPADDLRI